MKKFAVRVLKNAYHPLNVPESIDLEDGQMILVRTEKGEEVFKAFLVNSEISKFWEKLKPETLTVIRTLSQRDIQTLEEIRHEEVTSFFICQELVKKHKLGMNLVQCKITFDRKKITFYYTAAERVDFRELLKDLTQTFKRVRIDLRHIGVRDETSIIEGNGICGRPFCCCSFLRKFETINVKLAKDQNMPISPGKISGTCGRLLCCLTYEYSNYLSIAKELPPIGASVMTSDGLGKIFALQFLKGTVNVKLEDGTVKEFNKDDLEMVDTDVNVEINIQNSLAYQEDTDNIDISHLEYDKNSLT